jgi:2-dehydropantoate 2-reductase
MRILVVGAGAVGGYFGARLMQAGTDITFLVRQGRAAQLRRDGLRIVSPHGDATLQPKIVTREQIDGTYDLILLSVKGYGLAPAMEDFASAISPATMILPLLNGMRHIDMLIKRFGEDAVLGGICRISSDLDAEGRIVQLAAYKQQQVTYGERSGKVTPRIEAVHRALGGAGFEAVLAPDIVQVMWEKWVQLSSLGGATCLLRGTIGDIMATPGGETLLRRVLRESTDIATAMGHPPSEALLRTHTSMMTAAGSSLVSSMYRDLGRGLPVEADAIIGDLLAHGQSCGLDTPLLAAAYIQLSIYSRSRG